MKHEVTKLAIKADASRANANARQFCIDKW
jgi:hypothetical protein